ncbi:MAG: MerR family transcriptional regulator, partial [Candidatus Berkiella sp.]
SQSDKRDTFEKNWFNLVDEIKHNLKEDPKTAIGIALGKRCMDLVNNLYGTKYAHLRTKMFERGFGMGKGLEQTGMTPQVVAWLDVAICSYWHSRIDDLLSKIDKQPTFELNQQWNTLLDDMYGEDPDRKMKLLNLIFEEKYLNDKAKAWLQSIA